VKNFDGKLNTESDKYGEEQPPQEEDNSRILDEKLLALQLHYDEVNLIEEEHDELDDYDYLYGFHRVKYHK